MTLKEKIKVMQAFADGKKIEYKNKTHENWDVCISPIWNWDVYYYRIKEEPKYVPYTYDDAKELIGKVIVSKVPPAGIAIIGYVNENGVYVPGFHDYTFGDLLFYWKKLDGSPLGKIVL